MTPSKERVERARWQNRLTPSATEQAVREAGPRRRWRAGVGVVDAISETNRVATHTELFPLVRGADQPVDGRGT